MRSIHLNLMRRESYRQQRDCKKEKNFVEKDIVIDLLEIVLATECSCFEYCFFFRMKSVQRLEEPLHDFRDTLQGCFRY